MPLNRALPIALIVNELVGNALKYAFPDEQPGRVAIGFRRVGNDFVLTVSDNGVGFDPAAPARGGGLGTRLSRAFAGQLGGELKVGPAAVGACHSGVLWTVTFPVE